MIRTPPLNPLLEALQPQELAVAQLHQRLGAPAALARADASALEVLVVPRFYLSFEDDSTVWSVAEIDCPDEDAACGCAVQLLSDLFAKMHDDAPDWSRCWIRIAGRPVRTFGSAAPRKRLSWSATRFA